MDNLNLISLSEEQLISIDGGKNIVEYLVQGIGYAVGKVHNAYDSYVSTMANLGPEASNAAMMYN